MTPEILMVRMASGNRVPRLFCARCFKPVVASDAALIWNDDLVEELITGFVVCGPACETETRSLVPDIANWGRMSLAQAFLTLLVQTGMVAAVGELIEDFELQRFRENTQSGGPS